MSKYKRISCPRCGNNDPRKLHVQDDKNYVLYYSGMSKPVYLQRTRCGECGKIFDKDAEAHEFEEQEKRKLFLTMI